MKKTTLAFLGAALMAAGQASATVILFSGGNDPTNGPAGNSHTYSAGGISVTATAWSLLDGTDPWEESYLGRYSDGLGVTNIQETDHTIDNYGSIDAVAFEFSTAVSLDAVALSSYGDTDIEVWYGSGGSWTHLDSDYAGFDSRVADDFNTGGLTATNWKVSARDTLTDGRYVDRVKLYGIAFSGGAPSGTVPDTGGSLLLLAIGLGALRLFTLKRKK